MTNLANHSPTEKASIAQHNDALRKQLAHGANWVVITPRIAELIGDTQKFRRWHSRANLLRLISEYDEFGPDNDPFGTHDFGCVDWEGSRVIWKIDYYPLEKDGAWVLGVAEGLTERVLTIMLASEF